jgi:hypothetical protein
MALYYIQMNISRVLVGACTTPGCRHVLSKEFKTKPSQLFSLIILWKKKRVFVIPPIGEEILPQRKLSVSNFDFALRNIFTGILCRNV